MGCLSVVLAKKPHKYYCYKFHFRFIAYENYSGKKSVLNERNTICNREEIETKAWRTTTAVFQTAITASEIHLRIYRINEDPVVRRNYVVLLTNETLKSTFTDLEHTNLLTHFEGHEMC